MPPTSDQPGTSRPPQRSGDAFLLGIDAGTTSVKAGVFAPDGRCLGIGREEYDLSIPAADQAELDAEIYWQASVRAVRSAMAQARVAPQAVLAAAVSSQGETVIPVDAQGRPLRPALVWLDNRAVKESAQLAQIFAGDVYRVTGVPEIVPTWSACKVLWLRQHEPQVFAAARKYLLVQDFILHRLTGEFVTNGAVAGTTLFYDLTRHAWWDEMLAAAGIDAGCLPRITQPGEVVGKLTPAAAAELGLTTHTLAVGGGMDQCAGAIGAGNVVPEVFSETTGAALAMMATVSRAELGGVGRIPACMHSAPGKYLLLPYCPTGGMALKWFRDVFAAEEMRQSAAQGTDAYEMLTRSAQEVAPGADGLVMLPHLMGALSPENNMAARGGFVGFTLGHTRAHFVRALLEGVACMLRRNLDMFRAAGIRPAEMRTSGGGARSRLWNQIKADVCGLPVVRPVTEEAALLGDAILAAAAAGVFRTVEEGCAQMVALGERIEPGEQSEAYQAVYRRYCDLDDHLSAYWRRNYSG